MPPADHAVQRSKLTKRQQQKQLFSLQSLPRTLWLFSKSDFKTHVLPVTAFGLFAALAGPLTTTNTTPNLLHILARVPHALLWSWLNTLVQALANQRLPEAIEEDRINKPSRPIPAGRISANQTRRLLLVAIPLTLAITYALGAWQETALLFVLTWMYNDLGGGEEHFLARDGIVAVAFAGYNMGALRVVLGGKVELSGAAYIWLAIVSLVIFATMKIVDMKDQEGDRARGRRTAPLVLGDGVARWAIAGPVVLSSVLCPWFWGLGAAGYVLPVGIGAFVAVRVMCLRSSDADRKTWKFWALWIVSLYLLPPFKDHRVFAMFVEAWL